MDAKIKNNTLIIEIPIQRAPKLSKTGKTKILASTGGNKPFELKVNDKLERVYIGAFAFFYPSELNTENLESEQLTHTR